MTRASQPDTPEFLATPNGQLAYHRLSGDGPGLMFCGGFASDMTGTKAMALEAYARSRGRGFLRFDYRGHGQSSGDFADGTIGGWLDDALAAFDALTDGPQILVGSSMGGWIALLLALARPERVQALVGVAAAPDFTEDLMWAEFDEEVRAALTRDRVFRQPSAYSDQPTTITMDLIEEGRRHLVLRAPIPIRVPVRLIHGMRDPDVPYPLALTLADRLESDDVEVRLLKNGDHRLSTDADLRILTEVVDGLAGG